jgi:hypothetical protein
MRAQGRRVANGPVWADWFLELEEMLERRKANRSRYKRSSSRRSQGTGDELCR